MIHLERTDTEQGAMQIILHAGNARSDAYEALAAIKAKRQPDFDQHYATAVQEIKTANQAHAQLLRALAAEDRMKDVDLLLVHAEDHLTSADVMVRMVAEFAELYQWKNGNEVKIDG